MSKIFSPRLVFLLFLALLFGCSHSKTNRGHLFRGDWAFEYNRTPWIGLPPDSGCPEETEEKSHGLFDCFKKDNDRERKGFRRHCGQNAECTPQNPCCRTLGCGMWIDPANPAALASLGGTAKACGLTPFCSPQKPCRLTPNCGKPINVQMMNPQMLAGGGMVNGMAPTLTLPPGGEGTAFTTRIAPGGQLNAAGTQGMTPGAMQGTLVSRGIVPGASTITSGGLVAAIGVSTPAGTMTPIGVRMHNGMVSNAIVLRACMMSPNCTAAHPCGLTPNCGGAVAVNLVSNNAAGLAVALQQGGAQSAAQSATQSAALGQTGMMQSGMMQPGGMGMLVNPVTNQPINGLSMGGYAQAGYPPIGYAPAGYAPGYPRFAAGNVDNGLPLPSGEEGALPADETMPVEEETIMAETRSSLPVPRFHPIPSKPAFQRSEGMPATPKAQRSLAKPETAQVSDEELETALDQAYLQGVSAAMSEVERKLEQKRQAAAKVKLEEKILRQAESVQEQLEEQDRLRQLVLQRDRQLRQQQAARMQPVSLVAEMAEPQRLSPPQRTEVMQRVAQQKPAVPAAAQANPTQSPMVQTPMVMVKSQPSNRLSGQLVEDLKTSMVSRVNEVFTPLLGLNQKVQRATPSPPRQPSAKQAAAAITPPNLPGKPSVLPTAPNYGLMPENDSNTSVQQARFTE